MTNEFDLFTVVFTGYLYIILELNTDREMEDRKGKNDKYDNGIK